MIKTFSTILFATFLGWSVFGGVRVAQPKLHPLATANGRTTPQGFQWGNVDFENGVL